MRSRRRPFEILSSGLDVILILSFRFFSSSRCRCLNGNCLVVPRVPKIFEVINAGDTHALSLALLVQEVKLLYWRGKNGCHNEIVTGPFEKINLKGVFSFRNLKKLTMDICVTSSIIIEQLGKFVQLQSLHTCRCQDEEYGDKVSYGALSNLQSLHALE